MSVSEDVRCGVTRTSMKTNCLLKRPELGKVCLRRGIPLCGVVTRVQVKSPTTALPPLSHAYGVKSATHDEGAREGRHGKTSGLA